MQQQKNKNGFNKQQRLLTPAEYKKVYKTKVWGRNRLFSFNIAADNQQQSRLGITVSKKVSKLAVQRNRIKRQIREYFRLHQTELKNVDLVISAMPACQSAKNTEIIAALNVLWKKILKQLG